MRVSVDQVLEAMWMQCAEMKCAKPISSARPGPKWKVMFGKGPMVERMRFSDAVRAAASAFRKAEKKRKKDLAAMFERMRKEREA